MVAVELAGTASRSSTAAWKQGTSLGPAQAALGVSYMSLLVLASMYTSLTSVVALSPVRCAWLSPTIHVSFGTANAETGMDAPGPQLWAVSLYASMLEVPPWRLGWVHRFEPAINW